MVLRVYAGAVELIVALPQSDPAEPTEACVLNRCRFIGHSTPPIPDVLTVVEGDESACLPPTVSVSGP